MNPHDYIVSVNEKGEPYLEHALFGKSSQKQNHKYYTRVQDKGRWRYFYSPQEFRVWQAGGSKKKVTNTDKMRSAFKQIKETGQKVAEKARDVAGFDERDRMRSAKEKLDSDSTNALNRFKRHTDYTKAKSDYDKTLLGRTERMREELRKKAKKTADEVADKVKEKVKEKVDDVKETYQHNKEQFEKAKEMERAEAERQAKLENRPKGHEKNVTGEAKEASVYKREKVDDHKSSNVDIHKKSERGDYDENDPDFSDANYDKATRIGDSDFLTFKRKDGTSVILEEDSKWVLPKGVDGNDPEIKQAIDNFSRMVERERSSGTFTSDQWNEQSQAYIDEACTNAALRKKTQNSQAKYSSYTDGDSDFDDDNYKEEGRVGDSDFFVHTRKDGTSVLLEEDMKWVLPKGVNPNAPSIKRAIQKLADNPKSVIGKDNYSWADWAEAATDLINDAVADAGMSEEYLEDREFNSRKNK